MLINRIFLCRFIPPNIVTCPHHPLADLIEDSHAGDTICAECGLVVGDRFVILSIINRAGYAFNPELLVFMAELRRSVK